MAANLQVIGVERISVASLIRYVKPIAEGRRKWVAIFAYALANLTVAESSRRYPAAPSLRWSLVWF